MISRHVIVVFRHHEVTSDRPLQIVFFRELFYGESFPLASVPAIEEIRLSCYVKYVERNYKLCIRLPSTQSSLIKSNRTLILFIDKKYVTMFAIILRRRRSYVLRQNFTFGYIFLRYIPYEPMAEFSIISSPPWCIRIYKNIKQNNMWKIRVE